MCRICTFVLDFINNFSECRSLKTAHDMCSKFPILTPISYDTVFLSDNKIIISKKGTNFSFYAEVLSRRY